MSIEFSLFQRDGQGINASNVIRPGEKKTLLVTVNDEEPPELLAYEVACWRDNTGGVFTQYTIEDRGQLYGEEPFEVDNEEILDMKTFEILHGEAGQWELPSNMIAVFHHTTGPREDVPPAFYK